MSWLSSFIGDLTGRNASNNAIAAQAETSDRALDLQERQFDRSIDIIQPWLTAGGNALAEQQRILRIGGGGGGSGAAGVSGKTTPIAGGIGGGSNPSTTFQADETITAAPTAFESSPFYQTMMGQTNYTMDLLDGRATASGNALSGAHKKDLFDTARRDSNAAFGQYWNALAGMSGSGQVAAGQGSGAAQSFGNNSSSILLNHGNALASAYQTQGQQTADLYKNVLGTVVGGFF